LKKNEETKQEISRIKKELQRLENVKDLTQMKLQDLLKQKDNIIDSSTELTLEEKIHNLTVDVSKLRRIPEAVWNNLRNSFNKFQL
jgi:archaellum component FlaC